MLCNDQFDLFQDSTFPVPVPSGYSTLQARHYAPAQPPHRLPPPSGFTGPAHPGQARYRDMSHLGTLPRPQPSEKEYLMSGSGFRGGVSGAGPESNI